MVTWRLAWFLPIGVLAIAGSIGCDPPPTGSHSAAEKPVAPAKEFSGQYPIKVVCTTGMVADLAKRVGGQHVDVSALMGEGVDPHLYKASSSDVSRVNRADLVFYSGLHLEGKMADFFERLARKKPTFAVTQGLPHDRLLVVGGGLHDPHVWFDVDLWSESLRVVETSLIDFDPPHAAEYKSNAATYLQELTQLHAWCGEQMAAIPESQRVLVTAHDAFHYFGRAYDVQVKAIQGISTESEAGVREINELVDFLKERRIKAVFVESSVSDRNIRALVEGCQSRGHSVLIGGELFSDAMGKAGTPEGTYVGMVRHNVNAIRKALE